MFNSFTGIVSHKGADYCYLQVGAIEWRFFISLNGLTNLKLGKETKLYSFLQHKEEGMTLFGFTSLEERELFLNLIKVNGVGPKAAIKMLSGLNVEGFITALESEDVSLLTRIPGLGKATAQKIILALKGKLVIDSTAVAVTTAEAGDELVQSLVAMGFDGKKAKQAVLAVKKRHTDKVIEEKQLIKEALVEVSKL
jgi:Holliday junction DNA helicase RuvA